MYGFISTLIAICPIQKYNKQIKYANNNTDISGKKNENKNEDNFLKHKKEKGNNVICEYSDKFRFDDEQEKEMSSGEWYFDSNLLYKIENTR